MFQCIGIKCINKFLITTDCYKLTINKYPISGFSAWFPPCIIYAFFCIIFAAMFFIFLIVISPIKLLYSLQEAQLDVAISWCPSGWVWWSAISFSDVFWVGVDGSMAMLIQRPTSFPCHMVQTSEFTSHCACCFRICSGRVFYFVWRPIFYFLLFVNVSPTKFSIIEFFKNLYQFLLCSFLRRFWMFFFCFFLKITCFFGATFHLSFPLKFFKFRIKLGNCRTFVLYNLEI